MTALSLSLPKAVRLVEVAFPWVSVEFDEGSMRWFDTSEFFAYPFFQPLKDKGLFDRASIAYGTVVWPGEIDIAPESLWLGSVEHKPSVT